MPTITISESSANELRNVLNSLVEPKKVEPVILVEAPKPPVVETPRVVEPTREPAPSQPIQASSAWQEEVIRAAREAGYDPVRIFEWDWDLGGVVFDTAYRGQVLQNGIVVASFVAKGPETSNLFQLDAIGYPAPNQGNQLKLSVSTKPCDFNVIGEAISISEAPTITACVGKPPRFWWNNKPTALGLVPGVRYYVNVTGKDSYDVGAAFIGRKGEFRLALRVPAQ